MRKVLVMAALSAQLVSCGEAPRKESFDAAVFLRNSIQVTRSNAALSETAAKRSWAAVTRNAAASIAAEQRTLRDRLQAIAAKRAIAPPPDQQRHVALRENLSILPGQVFDRGYTLAMVQEMRSLQREAERAAASGDPQLEAFAREALPRLQRHEALAREALERNGGSPFEF